MFFVGKTVMVEWTGEHDGESMIIVIHSYSYGTSIDFKPTSSWCIPVLLMLWWSWPSECVIVIVPPLLLRAISSEFSVESTYNHHHWTASDIGRQIFSPQAALRRHDDICYVGEKHFQETCRFRSQEERETFRLLNMEEEPGNWNFRSHVCAMSTWICCVPYVSTAFGCTEHGRVLLL